MRLNLVNTGVRYNATDVRLDSGKALDKTLSPGNIIRIARRRRRARAAAALPA